MSNKSAVLAKFPEAKATACGCGCGFFYIYDGPRFLGGWWGASHAWKHVSDNLTFLMVT